MARFHDRLGAIAAHLWDRVMVYVCPIGMRGGLAPSRHGFGSFFWRGLYSLGLTLCVASGVASGQPAHTDEPRDAVRLQYENRSGIACPDRNVLARDVVARLGYDPFSEKADSDVLLVTIHGERRGLRGDVRWAAAAGRRSTDVRTIQSASGNCVELVQALALTMSIVIDPLRASELQEPPGGSTPAAPGPSAPKSSAQPSPAQVPTAPPTLGSASPAAPASASASAPSDPSASPARTPPTDAGAAPSASGLTLPAVVPTRVEHAEGAASPQGPSGPKKLRFGLLLGVHATIGLLPQATGGVVAGVEMRADDTSVVLSGRFDAPASVDVDGGSVAASSALGSLGICHYIARAFGCAFGRVGRLQGAGNGFHSNGSGAALMTTVGLGGGYDVLETGPLRLRLYAETDVPLTGNSLNVDGDPKWKTSIAATLGLGMLTTIP